MDTNEIKQLVKSKQLLVGVETIRKKLAQNKIEHIWYSQNANPKVKEEFAESCELTGAQTSTLSLSSEELGIICKKQFHTSVVAKGKD